ncbi:Hypothetical protein FKW44_023171, partial [Caligus rogercresseyi]
VNDDSSIPSSITQGTSSSVSENTVFLGSNASSSGARSMDTVFQEANQSNKKNEPSYVV